MPSHSERTANALPTLCSGNASISISQDAYEGGGLLRRVREELQTDAFGIEAAENGSLSAIAIPARRPSLRWLETLPPCGECLRPHQRRQLQQLAQVGQGSSRVLVQLCTGGGKTHELAVITAAAIGAGLRVLILATRNRLVRQIHERLQDFGLPHGIIAAAVPGVNYSAPVQVASADTLHRRAVVARTIPMPLADVVIFDEAHLATANTRLGILERYPNAVRIGFTATPARKSGLGLAKAFDQLIVGPPMRELIAAGILVPPRIYSTPVVSTAELKDVPRDTANDYAVEALGDLLSRPKLVGDVVANWLRIANGKRTLVFAVHKAHGAALVADFLKQGVSAELLTDDDDEDTREEAIARLETGQTHVLVNCFLLSYGIDIPTVECVVLARPTRSLAMFLQMAGRGARAAEGKTHYTLIDHGRVVETLGLPQSDFPWTLEEGRNVNAEAVKKQAALVKSEQARTCPECSALWLTSEDGNACPACGWKPPQRAKDVRHLDAELEELAERPGAVTANDAPVSQFYREALGWFAQRKPQDWRDRPKSIRWAAWMRAVDRFKLTEERPPWAFWSCEPLEPSQESAGWLLSRQIRWARSRARSGS